MEIERVPSLVADITVFRLKGPFTLSSMFDFQAALRSPEVKGTIIDLSGVSYMDSAGLGVLLGNYAHTQRAGFKFALAGVSSRLRTLFEITHTDQVLPLFASQADAEKSFGAGG